MANDRKMPAGVVTESTPVPESGNKRPFGDKKPVFGRRGVEDVEEREPLWLPQEIGEGDLRNLPLPLKCDENLWQKILYATDGRAEYVSELVERSLRCSLHSIIEQMEQREDKMQLEAVMARAGL